MEPGKTLKDKEMDTSKTDQHIYQWCFFFPFFSALYGFNWLFMIPLLAYQSYSLLKFLVVALEFSIYFFFFLFLVRLGFEFRTPCLQSRNATAWATPPIHFDLVILETGSQELLALAGLELRFSWA
jgi:hypothetical protein